MPDLGISVLLKGQNFMRMLAGLGVALKRFFAFTWKFYESCHKWYCYFSYFSGQRERLAGTYQEKMHQL